MKIAQLTDSHLFADKSQLHHGANVYQNLCNVLHDIQQQNDIDVAIFTGDLTQDHTHTSYQNFVDAVQTSQFNIPLYYLPGNHDEIDLLALYLQGGCFEQDTRIENDYWQIHLLNSKSDTPAGYMTAPTLQRIRDTEKTKHHFLFMHHHVVDLNYFIDRHCVQNKAEFWQLLDTQHHIKGVACGHVHRAYEKNITLTDHHVAFFTCPATSIEFDTAAKTVKSTGKSAGYRLYTLHNNGHIESTVRYV